MIAHALLIQIHSKLKFKIIFFWNKRFAREFQESIQCIRNNNIGLGRVITDHNTISNIPITMIPTSRLKQFDNLNGLRNPCLQNASKATQKYIHSMITLFDQTLSQFFIL